MALSAAAGPRPNASAEIKQVVAMGKSESEEVVPALIAGLESPDGNVHRLSACGLGRIGDRLQTEIIPTQPFLIKKKIFYRSLNFARIVCIIKKPS
jgi:hypothetical protein